MSQNYKAVIRYDGTDFYGWQIQKNGPTIQSEMQKAILKITSERPTVIGSGRTDSGVHAEGQVANFVLSRPRDVDRLLRSLNAVLPDTIRVIHLSKTAPNFHAQFSVRRKIYWYRIWNAPVTHPFWQRFTLHVTDDLDLESMQGAARHLLGRHDFRTFTASGATTETFQRDLYVSEFARHGRMITYKVAASGFLHHMVRNIVGTLLLVGQGRVSPSALTEILQSKDRRLAGPTAPAHGLSLKKVIYR
ncbi:MAG TPA: tRNA pseudouridine(38-40) synthase TruA [Acidobacteriota bacterium]|jgi:tRNA pseudouridine38-40 synthase|nr:tRNA pseudouridine(38-40) synthase TruA [Acidobacteriota bacterium]